MKRIILASTSPRRKELLEQIGVDFEVVISNAPEIITKTDPQQVVEELSRQKAEAVVKQLHGTEGETVCGTIVIGADTVVCKDGEIMGKPRDEADAHRMLCLLAGSTHSVFTGVTVIADGALVKTFSCGTRVHIYPMTQEEIQSYIETGEPMDKAGAYGIQGRFAAWVKGIEGDYNNVVGLPVSALWQVLKAL